MGVLNGVQSRARTESHTVVQNSIVLLVRYLAMGGLNAVLLLFLPRYLGDRGLGQLQFAQSFVALFSIAVALGTRQFLIKEVARDRSQLRTYLGTALGVRLIAGLLTVAAIVLVMQTLGFSREARWVVYIAAIAMVVLGLANVISAVLYGLENMTWPALSEIASKLFVMVVGIAVLVQGFGPVAYATVLLGGATVQLLVSAAYIQRSFPINFTFQPGVARALVLGGVPFLFMEVLLSVYRNTDAVMLRFMTAEEVVGWYAAATQLYGTVQFLTVALTTALLPTLARAHLGNVPVLIEIARKSIMAGIVVIVPMALGLSLLASEVIEMLPYPEVFRNSAPLLRILALSIPGTALLTILGTIAIAVDRQRAWSLALLVTVALNIGLNALAIPYFHQSSGNGAIGAALATLVCESLMVVVGVQLMPKGVIDRAMGLLLLKVAVSGSAMVLLGLWVKALGLGTAPLVVLGAFAYAGLILITRAVRINEVRFMGNAVLEAVRHDRKPGAQKEGPLP